MTNDIYKLYDNASKKHYNFMKVVKEGNVTEFLFSVFIKLLCVQSDWMKKDPKFHSNSKKNEVEYKHGKLLCVT